MEDRPRTPSRVANKQKFSSRAEKFCEFMTSLGYKLPKNTKPEHFDYIFQDEETAKLAKQLTRAIKPANIVDSKELEQFTKLQSEGRALYGAELEAAYERMKSREMEIFRYHETNIAKEEELNNLIEIKKAQIQKLKSIDSILSEAISENDKEEEVAKSREEYEKLECQRLDSEIRKQEQILVECSNKLQEKLSTFHTQLTAAQNEKVARLSQVDWMKFLEEEEKLNCIIKTMFKQYGSDLMMKEMGCGDADVVNPLKTEAMYRMFKLHETHLERLKHLITYEKIRERDLDINMAGAQAVIQNMDSIVEEAKQLAAVDSAVQNRMLSEIQSSNESFQEMLLREQTELYNSTRDDESIKLSSQIKEVFDLKSSAKKKLHEFFAFIVNILSHQRVRVDIFRELIRIEKMKNTKLAMQLREFRQRVQLSSQEEESIIDPDINTSGKLSIDLELLALCKKYNIPSSLYENPLTHYKAINLVKAQMEREHFIQRQKEEQIAHNNVQTIFQKQQKMTNLLQNLKLKTLVKDPMDHVISELESVHEKMEEKLNWHEKNKEQLAQDSITASQNLLKQIKESLEIHAEEKKKKSTTVPGPNELPTITDH